MVSFPTGSAEGANVETSKAAESLRRQPEGSRVDRETALSEYRRLLLDPQAAGQVTDDLRTIAEALGYGAQVAEHVAAAARFLKARKDVARYPTDWATYEAKQAEADRAYDAVVAAARRLREVRQEAAEAHRRLMSNCGLAQASDLRMRYPELFGNESPSGRG